MRKVASRASVQAASPRHTGAFYYCTAYEYPLYHLAEITPASYLYIMEFLQYFIMQPSRSCLFFLGLLLDEPHDQECAAEHQLGSSQLRPEENNNPSEPNSPLPPEMLPPPVPARYIVLLNSEDRQLQKSGKSTKEKAEKAIYGLQVHPAEDFDRSLYICHGGGNFQTGVVYQREFKCGRDGRYKYRAQVDYAEYAKDLKYQEFRDIVSALGAQSIKLLDDSQGSVQKKGSATVSVGSIGLGASGGKAKDTTTTVETCIEFSRPPMYQVVTKDTVDLANYEYGDEWQYILDGRVRPGPMKKVVQSIHFESDVEANAQVSIMVKAVKLEVGGERERTKGYTKTYEVTFFCPDDPEWSSQSQVSPSTLATPQSSSKKLTPTLST